jgi:hypothetical protein
VHTTAPSRGQDDVQYRTLAQAYLDFEPVLIRRLEDEPQNNSDDDVDAQANSQLQEEFEHSTVEERESEASYRPEGDTESIAHSSMTPQSKDSRMDLSHILNSPVLSFDSALDNADSPVWRGLHKGSQNLRDDSQTRQRISQASVEIADSQPEINRSIPTFSSQARILELYLQQIQSSEEHSSSSYEIVRNEQQGPSPELPYGIQHSQAISSEAAEEALSLTFNSASSPSPQKHPQKNFTRVSRPQKRSLPSTQDHAMSPKRKRPKSSLDDSHISSSAPPRLSIESSTVTTRTTRSRKRQCVDGSVNQVTRTKEATSSRTSMVVTSSAPSSQAKSTWVERLEIRPPLPRISTKDLTPDMLITPSLQQLAEKMPLAALFRPKDQTRDLRPMERGHWTVMCGNWDLGVRKRCWECLGNFIGSGLVGWGVWCIRDEDLDTVKVYCWGTTVGYIYLLLYMASESKIKRAGARWIGGDGGTIITMSG